MCDGKNIGSGTVLQSLNCDKNEYTQYAFYSNECISMLLNISEYAEC